MSPEAARAEAYTAARDSAWAFSLGAHERGAWRDIPSAPGAFTALLLARGALIAARAGGRALVEAPACLCLTERDAARMEEEADCRYLAIVFDPAIINDAFALRDPFDESLFSGAERMDRFYLHPFLEGRPLRAAGILPLNPVALERLAALFGQVRNQMTGQPDGYWPCRGRSFLLEMLFLIRQVYDAQEPLRGVTALEDEPRDMERVALYLHVHYAEKLSIEALSSTFCTNRTSLMERFKRYSGLTINEYVVKLRVQVAGVLLRDTGLPIQEILSRSGFKDPTHFGRTFRRLMNESPTEYRARLNWVLRPAS
jgi:AraC-like DNA-binding protein